MKKPLTLKEFIKASVVDPVLIRAVTRRIGWATFQCLAKEIYQEPHIYGWPGFSTRVDHCEFGRKYKLKIQTLHKFLEFGGERDDFIDIKHWGDEIRLTTFCLRVVAEEFILASSEIKPGETIADIIARWEK